MSGRFDSFPSSSLGTQFLEALLRALYVRRSGASRTRVRKPEFGNQGAPQTVRGDARRWFCFACLVLAGCGGADVDALLADLGSDDPETRRAAARKLGELKPTEPEVQAALCEAAGDPDREVRRLSCYALGEICQAQNAGPSEKAGVLDVLAGALEDSEMSVRLAAAYALLKIQPGHEGATTVLSGAMKLGDGGVIVAVTKEGPRAAWAVPTLTELLSDRRPGIRRLAAEGLGKVGTASQTALPALRQAATRDPDDRVRAAAAAAIRSIQNSADGSGSAGT